MNCRRVIFVLGLLPCLVFPATAEIKKPVIVPKASWAKVEPKSADMIPIGGPIHAIIVHHTAVPTKPALAKKQLKARAKMSATDKAEAYQRDHRELLRKFGVKKGTRWGDIAYHYFIDTNGTIVEARKDIYRGDSNTPYNMNGKLLVVLEGNFEFQEPSDKQKTSLNNLVSWLAKTNKVAVAMISGHRDQRNTINPERSVSICPGKNLAAYLPALRKHVAAELLK